MQKLYFNLLYITVLLFISKPLFTQTTRFQSHLVAGLNFAELEGNSIIDFFGINAGLATHFQFSQRLQIQTEFLFSQNTEAILPVTYPRINYNKIILNHIEVPVHLTVLLNTEKGNRTHHWNVGGGLAYTYLFHHAAFDEMNIEVTESILYDQRAAFLAQADLFYQWQNRYGLNLRISFPLQSAALDSTLTARLAYRL
ncbi:MAG: hypothetical protein AB8G22_14280 [Saprospiraceae bacterium]